MYTKDNPVWRFYFKNENVKINNCGKWMYFFTDAALADKMVKKAVETGVVDEAKFSRHVSTGVCCFYIDGSDTDAHKRLLHFLLENDLVPRTKAGKLYNISFKFDEQTHRGEYRENFKPEYRLSEFVDLYTGEFRK